MGQTLENGVYLPSEGERNCYAGLKTNWEILDQKVADVTALQQAVAGALHREIVESLPTTDINPNTIYMILSGTSATENVYDEYMYVNNAWELIGTSATDLTNYYTKAEVDGKLLLKANASDLTSHTGDTTIHVTTADKNKWNNQTYVFRYSSTALTASSTNSNALLDNTDNLKVGDKVIDSSGVLFSITAIDTANSTFTIGTALIDLAQDSDVVHTSGGNESISGYKTFTHNMTLYNSRASVSPVTLFFKNRKVVMGSTTDIGSQNIAFRDSADTNLSILKTSCESVGNTSFEISVYNKDSNNQTVSGGMLVSQTSANTYITPTTDNAVLFGSTNRRWSKIYGTEYYYGSNNVEFSDKFVTTDTAQTIGQNKTFTGVITINHARGGIFQLTCPDLDNTIDVTGNWAEFISFNSVDGGQTVAGKGAVGIRQFKNGKNFALLLVEGSETLYFGSKSNSDSTKALYPANSGVCDLGTSTNKWKTFNGLNPSALGMPDLSNGIDISSYITVTDNANVQSTYTPPSNGWVCVKLSRTSGSFAVLLQQENICGYGRNIIIDGTTIACSSIPVIKGVQVLINSALANGVVSAYFYPCQGNV